MANWFAMPFRPFFALAAIYGCVALVIWTLSIMGAPLLTVSVFWHVQEMLYGFALAVVVGFLLTAAQTWTQVPTVKGASLAALVGLWILARALSPVHPMLSAIADILFLTGSALCLLRMLIIAKNWRNLVFVPLLLALAAVRWASAESVSISMWVLALFIIIQFVMIVGGRVIPFFTARKLAVNQAQPVKALEYLIALSSVCFIAAWLQGRPDIIQITAAVVAVAHLIRFSRWQQKAIYREPLLWSLHVSYLLMILGFATLAAGLSQSAAIHLVAVGGIGSMILAMMSRVSLGHTGRPLTVTRWVSLSFSFIAIAAILRALASLVTSMYIPLLWAALAFWCLAYVIFLIHYLPILGAKRIDMRSG